MPERRSDNEARDLQGARTANALDAFSDANALLVADHSSLLDTETIVEPADIGKLWSLLTTRVPQTDANGGIYQHLADTAYLAVSIARSTKSEVPPANFAAAALLRNVAMLFGEREYWRKSIVSEIASKRLGIRSDIQSLLLPRHAYITPKSNGGSQTVKKNARRIYNGLKLPQKILEYAGFLAKRTPEGTMARPDRTMTFHSTSRSGPSAFKAATNTELHWLSSEAALQDIERSHLAQSYAMVYGRLRADFKRNGFDVEGVISELDHLAENAPERPEATIDRVIEILQSA